MVVLSEAVGFVPDVLQESQGKRVASEPQGFFFPGQIDLLVAFGQRDEHRRSQVAIAKRGQGGIELAFAAVDHQQIRKGILLDCHASKSPGDDFVDGAEIIDPLDALDLITPVSGFERQAIEELDQRGDGVLAAQMRDIDPFDDPRVAIHAEHLAQGSHATFGIDVEDLGLGMGVDLPTAIEVLQEPNLIAELGSFLEIQLLGRLEHLLAHLCQEPLTATFEKCLQPPNVALVVLLGNPQIARCRALLDGCQQAGAKPLPSRVARVDV